jgi:hypothetical protein
VQNTFFRNALGYQPFFDTDKTHRFKFLLLGVAQLGHSNGLHGFFHGVHGSLRAVAVKPVKALALALEQLVDQLLGVAEQKSSLHTVADFQKFFCKSLQTCKLQVLT